MYRAWTRLQTNDWRGDFDMVQTFQKGIWERPKASGRNKTTKQPWLRRALAIGFILLMWQPWHTICSGFRRRSCSWPFNTRGLWDCLDRLMHDITWCIADWPRGLWNISERVCVSKESSQDLGSSLSIEYFALHGCWGCSPSTHVFIRFLWKMGLGKDVNCSGASIRFKGYRCILAGLLYEIWLSCIRFPTSVYSYTILRYWLNLSTPLNWECYILRSIRNFISCYLDSCLLIKLLWRLGFLWCGWSVSLRKLWFYSISKSFNEVSATRDASLTRLSSRVLSRLTI